MNKIKSIQLSGARFANFFALSLSTYFILASIGFSNVATGAEETYIRTYTYQASEADSKLTARTIALQEVKTELLSELGTHVRSLVKQNGSSNGKQMGTIEIETLSAGISKVEILEEKWDGMHYVLKAQIKANPDDVLKSLNKMFNDRQKEEKISQLSGDLSKMQDKNNSIIESLTESRKEAAVALEEIARLRKQLAEKQTEQSTQSLKAQYQHQVDKLTLNEWFNSGLNERNSGNNVQAVNWFRKAADAGHAGGMTQLGIMYDQGKGVEKDDSEAFKLFSKAAEAGNVNSMLLLGIFLVNGRGVVENDIEAVKWFRKAADAGNSGGMTQLGIMYEQGKGVEKNDNEAFKLFSKAAATGNVNSMLQLGILLANGRGVVENDIEAVRWFRKAADTGNPGGMTQLGIMYELGKGVEKNENEAVNWFRKAASLGNKVAQNNLKKMGY